MMPEMKKWKPILIFTLWIVPTLSLYLYRKKGTYIWKGTIKMPNNLIVVQK